jgi:hypothetical protein
MKSSTHFQPMSAARMSVSESEFHGLAMRNATVWPSEARVCRAHADHQDAVVAKVQQHTRADRAEQPGDAATAAEHRGNQLARQPPDHRHRRNAESSPHHARLISSS